MTLWEISFRTRFDSLDIPPSLPCASEKDRLQGPARDPWALAGIEMDIRRTETGSRTALAPYSEHCLTVRPPAKGPRAQTAGPEEAP